ncbi:hypothetical protein EVAR_75839_1 [Eumeta japonica]|uniref:Uncharacterized protein n=1 Tax=Eumeta variegata TaxID=151549 RepID=A0A4C1TDY6_EUMVA|nr:hypothetical protein EVAR_75839_1 [Eumeta japonica]
MFIIPQTLHTGRCLGAANDCRHQCGDNPRTDGLTNQHYMVLSNLFEVKYIRPNSVPTITKTKIEKQSLMVQGFKKGKGCRVLIIHEAQGLPSEGTVIVGPR